MTTISPAAIQQPSFLAARFSLQDHKTIGQQYSFIVGLRPRRGRGSVLMRINLVCRRRQLPFLGEIKPEIIWQAHMHGTLMCFFVLSTVAAERLGTFLFYPLQLGVEYAFRG